MNPRNLRNVFMSGAALRHILTIDDGADDGPGGGAAGGGSAIEPAVIEEDEPAVDAGGDGGTRVQADDGDEQPAPKPQRTPWQAKRIDALTAQAKTAQEEAERERQERQKIAEQLAAYKALYGDNASGDDQRTPAPETGAGPRVYTEDEFKAEVARQAHFQSLNQKLEGLFEQGAKQHSETWTARVNQAGQAFGRDLGQRVDFFEALAKLPNAVDVYHELAGDLDHMSDVLAMNPIDLGMELAQMSASASKPKGPAVSRAPAPIDPIDTARGSTGDDMSKMSMDDFAKLREQQRAERYKERGY